MVVVATGNMLATIDASMVNVSLPAITQALDTNLATVQWVATAYLLTITALLLGFGRLADLLGRRPVYVSGYLVFTVAVGLCGLAQTIEQLILLRGIQGIGSAMMMAIGPAILITAFSPRERGKALGLNATAVAVGYSLGPGLGGFLLLFLDWRALFFARVPIGLLGAALALWVLRDRSAPSGRGTFDLSGAMLVATGLSALLLGLNRGQQDGWGSPVALGLFATFALLLLAFLKFERTVPHPMLQLSLFRNRVFAAANASSLLNYLSNAGALFLVPFFLVRVLEAGPAAIGIVMTAAPVATAVVGPLSGWLSDRFGSRWLSSAGIAITAIALMLLGRMGLGSTIWDLIPRMMLLGLGHGLFQPPNNSALMGSVPRASVGVASGMLATMRNLGMALGIAVAGAFYSTRYALLNSASEADAAAKAFQDAFLVLAAFAAAGIITSLVRGNERPTPRTPKVG